MLQLPGGTVTFAFTDVEGSTKLLQELGDAEYGRASSDHRRIVREAFGAHGGTEIDTQGDSFFFSFPRARDAVAAVVDAQRALGAHAWPQDKALRIRSGLHTGEPQVGDEGYHGIDVVRAARIAAAGHGGQILISETTRALIGSQLPAGTDLRDLGEVALKDVDRVHLYEISVDGAVESRPLKADRPGSFDERLAERIESYVERQLERSFGDGKDTTIAVMPTRLAVSGLAVSGLIVALIGIVVLVAAILLIRLVI